MARTGPAHPHGIDVSQWNIPPAGALHYGFVWVRASSADGGLHEDFRVEDWVALAKRSHVPFGFYHFAANGTPADAQAEALFRVVDRHPASIRPGGLGVVIDCEGSLDLPVARAVIAAAKVQDRRRHGLHGVGVYSGGWVKSHGGSTLGADFGWLADWSAYARPAGWSARFTRFWQYAPAPDRDVFCGTHRAFRRWLG